MEQANEIIRGRVCVHERKVGDDVMRIFRQE